MAGIKRQSHFQGNLLKPSLFRTSQSHRAM